MRIKLKILAAELLTGDRHGTREANNEKRAKHPPWRVGDLLQLLEELNYKDWTKKSGKHWRT